VNINLHCFECIRGTFPLAECTQTFAPWRRIHRESLFGNHEHCFIEKTPRIQRKPPVIWYSYQCVPVSHHSRCIFITNKIALRCSANPLVHTSIISLPLVLLLQKKPPKPWQTRGKHHARRTTSYQKSEPSRVIFSSHSFLLILIAIS
jgi:hypothetical protein